MYIYFIMVNNLEVFKNKFDVFDFICDEGSASISIDIDDPNLIYFMWLEIRENCRNQGYARDLINEVLDYIKNNIKKEEWITIEICAVPQEDNITREDLIAFYKSFGFDWYCHLPNVLQKTI